MYADVEIVMLSNDGEANPVTFVQNASLPTLSAQPALHTMGPVYVNGSALPGANSWSVSTGKSFTVPANDGDLFPTSAAVIDEVSTISVGHNDPLAALASIGLTGSSISADVVCYASGYSSGIVAKTGSVSVTIGTGDIRPSPMSLSQGSLASIGIDVSPISSNGTTYPLTISTSATIP